MWGSDMKIVRHHTHEGFRVAVIVSEGRKWMKLAYVGERRLKKVNTDEKQHMTDIRDARPVDIKRINQCARRFGANRKLVRS